MSMTNSEGKSSSTSDLQIPDSKVKRHGSLVNSLSSKAMRVKSRITGSFFSKGRLFDLIPWFSFLKVQEGLGCISRRLSGN